MFYLTELTPVFISVYIRDNVLHVKRQSYSTKIIYTFEYFFTKYLTSLKKTMITIYILWSEHSTDHLRRMRKLHVPK